MGRAGFEPATHGFSVRSESPFLTHARGRPAFLTPSGRFHTSWRACERRSFVLAPATILRPQIPRLAVITMSACGLTVTS